MTWIIWVILLVALIAFVGGFSLGRRRRRKITPVSKTETEVNSLVKENEALLAKIAEMTKRKDR